MEKSAVIRVSPEEARRRRDSGKAILICAFEADEKFRSVHLNRCIIFARLPDLAKDQESNFYSN